MSLGSVARRLAAAVVAGLCLALPTAASADPITPADTPSLPAFEGAAATANPINNPTKAPQNAYLAPDPNSNIHNDTWMTDTYRRPGPLGNSLVAHSDAKPSALCGSLTFNSLGRIVSVCPSTIAPPVAKIIDPQTLATIASYELPNAPTLPGTEEFQNITGGGYFFLDGKDRIWVPTKTNHLFVLGQTDDRLGLELRRDYDLTTVADPATAGIISALPDFKRRIWFATKQGGKVATLDPKTGRLQVKRLGEEIANSFAVGEDGVYIVTTKAMYRFKAGDSGRPRIVWRSGYHNSGILKPSQISAGSGTTPTLMEGGYVAITDNADPMNVVVYRTARKLHGERRKVCEVPVFGPGASATENSLIGTKRSLVVENNYGYQDIFGPNSGAPTVPGFARVDLNRKGTDCTLRWTNTDVAAPSVVPKLSTRTGLIYAYARPADPAAEGYYWTALDYRTGETVWRQYAGSGLAFNNNYAGLALGPGGVAYLGVTGGIVSLRDGGQ
jgi:hypothetical protein